jgi:hypothetical protein
VELQDVEEEVFEVFVQWLYSQRLANTENEFPAAHVLIKL